MQRGFLRAWALQPCPLPGLTNSQLTHKKQEPCAPGVATPCLLTLDTLSRPFLSTAELYCKSSLHVTNNSAGWSIWKTQSAADPTFPQTLGSWQGPGFCHETPAAVLKPLSRCQAVCVQSWLSSINTQGSLPSQSTLQALTASCNLIFFFSFLLLRLVIFALTFFNCKCCS